MNRKTIALLALFAGICVLCAVCAAVSPPAGAGAKYADFCIGGDGQIAIRVYPGWQEETIRPFFSEQDGTYYFFLPSVLCGRTITNGIRDAELEIDGRVIGRSGTFSWEEGTVYRVRCGEAEPFSVKFMASSGIPALFIGTDTGTMELLELGKENIEQGRIQVVEADGTVSYGGKLTIRGRGNANWHMFGKKAFNIKLNKAAGILGMARDKDWCLLSNAWDYSYMNNRLAFDMASEAGFSYVPGAEYADVYFDGDYRGIYLVTEKVEVDEDRIDITDLGLKNREVNLQQDLSAAEPFDSGNMRGVILDSIPADITGGYLIERDFRLGPGYEPRQFSASYFETADYGTAFGIKVPEYADRREVEYISSLTSGMEQAIRSPEGVSGTGKSWLEYIELTSWVRSCMVAEIAYDPDKDVTNAYYYKDTDRKDPRFHMGPVWDYDNRFGGKEGVSSPEVLSGLSLDGWFACLYEKPEFHAAVVREWNSFFRNYLRNEAPRKIDRWQEEIRQSVRMDLVRWPRGAGYPVKWPSGTEIFTDSYDFDEQADFLRAWLNARCSFLDSSWGELPSGFQDGTI